MRGAAGFLSVFAAVWWIAGVRLAGLSWLMAIGPALGSVVLYIVARQKAATLPPRGKAEGDRIGRLIMIWSAVEGVAIFIGINIAVNMGHRELMPVAGGIAVALHFFPLARGIPAPTYYGTGAAMLAAGIAAIAAPAIVTPALFCLAAAVILWVTLALGIARAKPTSQA
ncbi:MAG: hypothetical protein KGN34_00185 [Sphingomonadales bacterium]|nr:hypothetical protein [Sphingomonadales bacterium]